MPMFHTAGGLCTLGALQTGGAQVLPPGYDPELMLSLFAQERATITLCVPTMLIRMLDSPSIAQRNLSSWRLVTLGGAPVPPELVRRAQEQGVKAAIGFGLTEASPYLTHTLPDDPHPDWISTVGRPMPQTEIKIVSTETGAIVPVGEIGEICGRGYTIMKDYFDNPEATRSAIDPEGWLHTGDLGSLDEHGYCRSRAAQGHDHPRRREYLPREIEDVLYTHPAVMGVSIVGIPERDWGEVPVGFVQIKPGHEVAEQELSEFCRVRLASYKVPRIWRFVDQFPQSASSKIQKYVLRELYLAEMAPDALGLKADAKAR